MKLMTAEALVKHCQKLGVKMYAEDDDINMVGGKVAKLSNSHPFWQLIKLHRDILCEHFGVSK